MKLLISLASFTLLAGCTASADPVQEPKVAKIREVVGTFQAKTYDISDHEHVVAFDMPNRIVPSRCWTYVNEKTATSNMHCDSDEPGTEMPPRGGPIDR
jgi:hypothetical protein